MAIQTTNAPGDLAGKTLLDAEEDQSISGLKTFSRAPAAPFAVQAASAMVANLNAERLGGSTLAQVLASVGSYIVGEPVVLTNADILGLADSFFEIVPAPAVDKCYDILGAILIADFAAAGYGNVHAGGDGDAYLVVGLKDGDGHGTAYLQNVVTDGITSLTDFFAIGSHIVRLGKFQKLSVTEGEVVPKVENLSDVVGNIVLYFGNDGDGALTGGDSANTLTVIPIYTIFDLP